MITSSPSKITPAFEALLAAIDDEIRSTNLAGAEKMTQGQYTDAKAAADRGSALVDLRSKVVTVTQFWASLPQVPVPDFPPAPEPASVIVQSVAPRSVEPEPATVSPVLPRSTKPAPATAAPVAPGTTKPPVQPESLKLAEVGEAHNPSPQFPEAVVPSRSIIGWNKVEHRFGNNVALKRLFDDLYRTVMGACPDSICYANQEWINFKRERNFLVVKVLKEEFDMGVAVGPSFSHPRLTRRPSRAGEAGWNGWPAEYQSLRVYSTSDLDQDFRALVQIAYKTYGRTQR